MHKFISTQLSYIFIKFFINLNVELKKLQNKKNVPKACFTSFKNVLINIGPNDHVRKKTIYFSIKPISQEAFKPPHPL